MSSDTLTLDRIECWTRIGISDDERATEQRLLVTIVLAVDTRDAAREDDIARSIDYAAVVADVRLLAQTERKTIERLADDIAQAILRKHRPSSVDITVEKFALPGVRAASIRISRGGVS